MALTTCKECGKEVSKQAAKCPSCGAPAKKKTSLFTWLVLAGIIGYAATSDYSTTASTGSASTREPSARETAMNNVELNLAWRKAGFDNVMLADFTVTNSGDRDIRDIAVRCTQYAKSGASLNTNRQTIFDIVPVNSAKTFSDFNMGLIHQQTDSTSCVIYDLAL